MKETATSKSRLPYLPSVDGIRGLSILAVLLFHAGFSWMKGGFLGVEIFFVVSGYLITSLLVSEHRSNGRISLKSFWQRRARRLLPAVIVLIAVTVLLALLFARDELVNLRSDVLACLLYVQNWHLIFSNQSYFMEVGRPSLLQHLWSLAIEEQFYLLWPLLLGFLFKKSKKPRALRKIMSFTLLMAVASQALSLFLSVKTGHDRAYYGTDARLTGLMLGAALALYVRPIHALTSRPETKKQTAAHNFIAIGLVAGISYLLVSISPYGDFIYRGGFLLIDVLSAMLILTVMIPGSAVGWLLGIGLMRYLGTRSYSLYLWHWPIFQLLRPGVDVMYQKWQVTLLRFGLTFLAAELSYRLIEQPLRTRVLPWRYWSTKAVKSHVRFAGVVVAAVICVVFVFRPVMLAGEWLPHEYLQTLAETKGELGEKGSVSIYREQTSLAETQTVPSVPTVLTAHRPEGLVTIIGDSVVLGAGQSTMAVIGDPVLLNAQTNRQPSQVPGIVQSLIDSGQMGSTLIIAIGWNGLIRDSDFTAIVNSTGEGRRVFWVIPAGDRPWIRESAALLRNRVPETTGARIIEWDTFSTGHPDWFVSDGIHASDVGKAQFANLLAQAIMVL